MIKVIKRDGRKVDFDWSKITDAILKAYCDVYKEIALSQLSKEEL